MSCPYRNAEPARIPALQTARSTARVRDTKTGGTGHGARKAEKGTGLKTRHYMS